MITLQDITVRYGGFELFSKLSLTIAEKERIGLVGRNGAGKSTLLKIITGIESPESGKVNIPNDARIGYLPQKMVFKPGKTVIDETLTAFEELQQIEFNLNRMGKELGNRTDYESKEYLKLIERHSELSAQFEMLGGGNIQADSEKVLKGLGFEDRDLDQMCQTFSGGWRMRIELAKILLRKPDVLLLDEPTNHLDIESILWLEEFLANYKGSLLLISHDRQFLDAVTNRTVEIYRGSLHDYRVPYTKFLKLREERNEQIMAAYRNQQKLIEKTEDFIERFRYKATKANQVQSRVKQLEKLEVIEIEENEASIHFRFPNPPRSGDIVCELKELGKSYGEKQVLKGLNLTIERGEKIAYVGRNGEGKTTLARIIHGELDHSGKLKLGHNVEIGYYAQNQAELMDENKTVLETIEEAAVGDIRTKVRTLLGSFLFGKEEVDKKVKVLSGGERSRLSMIKLLLKPVPLLILDEPTNHLDLKSKDILKKALQEYKGTLIIVSHDRYFLDGLADKVYEFRNKGIKEHLGGIQDFLRKRKIATLAELDKKQGGTGAGKTSTGAKDDSSNKQKYLERKEKQKEIRKIENELSRKEKEVEKMEAAIAEMDTKLADSAFLTEGKANEEFYTLYNSSKRKLDQLMYEWELISDKLDTEKS